MSSTKKPNASSGNGNSLKGGGGNPSNDNASGEEASNQSNPAGDSQTVTPALLQDLLSRFESRIESRFESRFDALQEDVRVLKDRLDSAPHSQGPILSKLQTQQGPPVLPAPAQVKQESPTNVSVKQEPNTHAPSTRGSNAPDRATNIKVQDATVKRGQLWMSKFRLTLPDPSNRPIEMLRCMQALELAIGLCPVLQTAQKHLNEDEILEVLQLLFSQPLQTELTFVFPSTLVTLDDFWHAFGERYYGSQPELLLPATINDRLDGFGSLRDMLNFVVSMAKIAGLPLIPSYPDLQQMLFRRFVDNAQRTSDLRAGLVKLNSLPEYHTAVSRYDLQELLRLLIAQGMDSFTPLSRPVESVVPATPPNPNPKGKAPSSLRAQSDIVPIAAITSSNYFEPLSSFDDDETALEYTPVVAVAQPSPAPLPPIPPPPAPRSHSYSPGPTNGYYRNRDRDRGPPRVSFTDPPKGQPYYRPPGPTYRPRSPPQESDHRPRDGNYYHHGDLIEVFDKDGRPVGYTSPASRPNSYHNPSSHATGHPNPKFSARPATRSAGWNTYNDPKERNIHDDHYIVPTEVEKFIPSHLVEEPDFRRQVVALQRSHVNAKDPQFVSALYDLIDQCTAEGSSEDTAEGVSDRF